MDFVGFCEWMATLAKVLQNDTLVSTIGLPSLLSFDAFPSLYKCCFRMCKPYISRAIMRIRSIIVAKWTVKKIWSIIEIKFLFL